MTDILQMAILSLDAYNRGADRSILVPGMKIAGATVVNFGDSVSLSSPSPYFSATTYLLDGSDGKYVISYRGTDNIYTDGISGYLSAIGGITPQANNAIEYYTTVRDYLNLNSGSSFSPSIDLTGHSLGGGLAGLVSTLYGGNGVLFNNMTFKSAADTYHDTAESLENDPDNHTAQVIRDLIYGDGPIEALHTDNNLTYSNAHDPLGITRHFPNGNTTETELISGDGPWETSPVLGHSMALQTAVTYAYVHNITNWVSASYYLWNAFDSENVAAEVQGLAQFTAPAGTILDTMKGVIAYSAIDASLSASDKPFGDTALASMFDDIGDMTVAISGSVRPGFVENSSFNRSMQDIADISVVFAGNLATSSVYSSDIPLASNGVLSAGAAKDVLSVDLTDGTWALSGGTLPSAFRDSLVEHGFGSSERLGQFNSAVSTLDGLRGLPAGTDVNSNIQSINYQNLVSHIGTPNVTSAGYINLTFLAENGRGADTTSASTDSVRAVIGSNTNQTIIGHNEDDIFIGGDEQDNLSGGAGINILYGGKGSDILTSQGYEGDHLYGGDGSDNLIAEGYSATLEGGAGDDIINVIDGYDTTIRFGVGDGHDTVKTNPNTGLNGSDNYKIDMIGVNSGDVTYIFSASSTFGTLIPGSGHPVDIRGKAYIQGDLTIKINSTGDSIIITNAIGTADYSKGYFGSAWNWYFSGGIDDLQEITAGVSITFADTVPGPGGPIFPGGGVSRAQLSGSDIDNYTVADAGALPPSQNAQIGDVSQYKTAEATFAAATAATQAQTSGSSGDDYLAGSFGSDAITGGEGNDTFGARGGVDTIDGGAGDDTLALLGGRDRFDLTAEGGRLVLTSVDGSEGTVKLTAVEHVVFGVDNVNAGVLVGTSGDDILEGNGDNAIVLGAAGNDTLSGAGLGLSLFGGEGDDRLIGSAGSDYLTGGSGSDLLEGGLGSDKYIWSKGDGNDVISDQGSADDIDQLFLKDVGSIDIELSRDGDALIVTIASTGETIRITDQQSGTASAGINSIVFADGSSWDRASLDTHLNAPFIEGSGGDDILSGSELSEVFHGKQGNDTFSASDGNDVYLWNIGDGNDHITDEGTWTFASAVVKLGSDISTSSVQVTHAASSGWNGGDGVVLTMASGETIQIDNLSEYNMRAVAVRFEDGTTWDKTTLLHLADITKTIINGSDNADTLTGTGYDDVITGSSGNDSLNGGSGSDTYVYRSGDGNDTIRDYTDIGQTNILSLEDISKDQIKIARVDQAGDPRFAEPVDLLLTDVTTGQTIRIRNQFGMQTDDPTHSIDMIRFADGSTMSHQEIVAAISHISGTDGSDYLKLGWSGFIVDLGAGDDDLIVENSGSGTIVFQKGSGHDTLGTSGYLSSTVRDDTLHLVDANKDDVLLTMNGSSLLVEILSTGDTFTAYNQFSSGFGTNGISHIVFSDGTSWNGNEIYGHIATPDIIGTSGDDYLYTTPLYDTVNAGQGDDTIVASGGSDVYLWNTGDGNDTIIGESSYSEGTSTIVLGAGILVSDVSISYTRSDDRDFLLSFDTGGSINVQGVLAYGVKDIAIQFADGTHWDKQDIFEQADLNLVPVEVLGTTGRDYLVGTNHADQIVGYTGDDYLVGQDGGDTYSYSLGDGNDTISDSQEMGSPNTLVLTDINSADVNFERLGNFGDSVLMHILASGQTITLENQLYDSGSSLSGVDIIQFADGSSLGRGDIAAISADPQGTDGDDFFQINWSGWEINLGLGNDTINVQGPQSGVLTFGLGDGNDIIHRGDSPWMPMEASIDVNLKDITSLDATLFRDGNNLLIENLNSTDSIKVVNAFAAPNQISGIHQISFSDGIVWDDLQILAHI